MDKEYTPAEAKAWLAGYDAGKKFGKKEWVGLTDLEIDDVQCNIDCRLYRSYARAIEAKLREKSA